MNPITIEHNPTEARLAELGVRSWPIWEKEASEFPWFYDEQETCYLLEGDVVVGPVCSYPVVRRGECHEDVLGEGSSGLR